MTDTFPRQQARTRRFSLGAPRGFRVAPDGSRIAFLRSVSGTDPVNRLWVHDVAANTARIVADPAELLGEDTSAELPPEERARRERAREAGEGIVSFTTDSSVTGAVFALAGRLFTTSLLSGDTAGLPSADGVFDPRPDPTGRRVAYVASGALRVTSLEDGDSLVVGSDNPDITYGTAEFIAAEEMGRSRGYWWSPDGDALLVARVDNTSVNRWHIASPISPQTPPSEIGYPAAGTTNATVGLEIHALNGAPIEVSWNPSGEWEYLADASWASRQTPTLVVQARDQRTTAVLEVDTTTGSCTERYRWTDEHWTEIIPGAPCWVGSQLVTIEDLGTARRLVVDADPITGDDLQVRRIIHASADGILVAGSVDATETHLFHVTLSGDTTPLTTAAGIHNAVHSGGDITVVSVASMDHPRTRTDIVKAGKVVGQIESLAEAPLITPTVAFHRCGDRLLNTAVLFPQDHDPDVTLPVLLDPYGGPHAQRVQKAQGQFGVSQWFANQGFAVVVTDGRGTPGRGPAFEREVWGDLAQPVLDDQLDALDAVAELYPNLDLTRVGIRGWSFGGYLAALAVLRSPDRVHAAVAGAPVTDWRLYDTHYTERYLGHPELYPDHYRGNDLTIEADKLTRPLLLIHGLADDNVVAAHTLKMSQALLEAGRPHQVLPLSGVTHMTPQEVVAENLLTLQLEFLTKELG